MSSATPRIWFRHCGKRGRAVLVDGVRFSRVEYSDWFAADSLRTVPNSSSLLEPLRVNRKRLREMFAPA